jgi:small subunit ribosomal protein S8
MLHDPLSDALSSIKNAEIGGKLECVIKPSSKIIGNVLKVFHEQGFIEEFEFIEDGHGGKFGVKLLGKINDCGVIKPRHSIKRGEFEKWEKRYLPAKNVGSLILSTSRGIISHQDAEEEKIGGVLLAFIY